MESRTDPTLENHIRQSPHLLPLAHKLASTPLSEKSSSSIHSGTEGSENGDGEDGMGDGGEREIVELARTVLELLDVEHKE